MKDKIPPLRPCWPEAEIIQEPVKRASEPRVIVRRRVTNLTDPFGNEIVSLPGPAHVSLFAGVDGFGIGCERAGFVTVLQHEWDETCCETLLANRPRFFRNAALIQGDMKKTPTSMLLKYAGLRVGEVHIVTGGPPCQGFSSANSNACNHLDDNRNDLVFEFLRCVNEMQPRYFTFENVPGFMRFQQGKYMEDFLRSAHNCFYELVYGLVNAVEYGVPQDRCRFICMGSRRDLVECDGLLASLPAPECFGNDDLRILRARSATALALAPQIRRAPGIRYFPDRPVLCPPDPMAPQASGRAKGFIEFYARIEREEPDRLVQPLKAA